MAADTSGLEKLIAKLRASRAFIAAAAPAVADAVGAELRKTAAAGTTPTGEAWAPAKDGRRPLENAAAAIQVRSSGTTIVATLTGPEVRHNNGTAKGRVKRQILPSAMTPAIAEAIKGALIKAWEAAR
jgi:hypothetical protein